MPTIKKRKSAVKTEPQQEIRTIAHHISDYVAAHRKNFTIILSVCAAVLIVIAGYSLMRSSQEQKAAPLAAAAYEAYTAAQNSNQDYTKALEMYRSVQKQYPSTMSGAISQYYIGNCLMNSGNIDEALKEYQAFVQKYSGDTFLLGFVYERMGYAYSAVGKQTDAIKAFQQSTTLVGPGIATMELAKLYEAAGNTAEAQKAYKLVADKLAGTMWAMEAMGKVQKIGTPAAPATEGK